MEADRIQYLPGENCDEVAVFCGQQYLAGECKDYPGTPEQHARETWTVPDTADGWEDAKRGQWIIRHEDGTFSIEENVDAN